ncbi:MAG: tRNA pseudouridine(55) synthase TruB [Rhodospirillaceae bacterium]|nr:tRNA pseudouridine(55) synthase TruB [Rhodospirillaceae bacterium]
MARKRKGLPIHGWFNIDKPAGMSSSDVVTRVRRYTGAAKAGHGGTLDPLATGVLPIALGEATKTVSYAMDGLKTYRFEVRWGIATTTDDTEGEVLEESSARPVREAIKAALANFTGDIEQVPPAFSAIKVNGRRAYELARRDEAVELAPRQVHIEELSLVEVCDGDRAVLEMTSGKGVYVRSLARDLARALGTVGHVAWLRRTAVAGFLESDAISLDKLEALGHSAAASDILLPVETVLDDIPALALTQQEANRLRHGQGIAVLPVASRSPFKDISQGDTVVAMAEGKLVALAKIAGGEIRPVRVMNY